MSDVTTPPTISHASARRSRRLSIIWLIPLIAVAIGGWLAWDTLSKEGPTITLSFESGEGLQAGQSQLKFFKDIVLGTVKGLGLTADHAHVLVTVATTRQANPLLTDTTIFWVVKPRLFAGNLSGLSTLLSGAYIGMLPGAAGGKQQRELVGREDPPVLEANVPGHTFLLKASRRSRRSQHLTTQLLRTEISCARGNPWKLEKAGNEVAPRILAPFSGQKLNAGSPDDCGRYVYDAGRIAA